MCLLSFCPSFFFSLHPIFVFFHKRHTSLLMCPHLHTCIYDLRSVSYGVWTALMLPYLRSGSVCSLYVYINPKFSQEWGGGMETAITHMVNRQCGDGEGLSQGKWALSQVCLSNELISSFYSRLWQQHFSGCSILLTQKKWTTGPINYNSAMEWEIWKNNQIIICVFNERNYIIIRGLGQFSGSQNKRRNQLKHI